MIDRLRQGHPRKAGGEQRTKVTNHIEVALDTNQGHTTMADNTITINGKTYVLIETDTNGISDCVLCALRDICQSKEFFCNILEEIPVGYHFIEKK